MYILFVHFSNVGFSVAEASLNPGSSWKLPHSSEHFKIRIMKISVMVSWVAFVRKMYQTKFTQTLPSRLTDLNELARKKIKVKKHAPASGTFYLIIRMLGNILHKNERVNS